MKALFWLSTISILYVYIGYPILIYILSRFYKKPIRGKYIYPKISIIISAYNEERHIEKKIKNLLELDYPKERMEIVIGSDGSNDKTDEIVVRYSGSTVKFYKQPYRQGKPGMLNILIPKAEGEVLIFTDARQRLDKNSLNELVKHFADTKVGSVSAALFYESENGNKAAEGVGIYWKYEKFIRKSESRMGSMLGATGALYAIRKELFPHLPADLILDDVYVPMKIVERGYRAIFDKKAKVYDQVFKSPQEEFARKVRTLAGNFQLFYYLGYLFNPFKGKISWQFFSHKFLRLMVPFLLILIFLSSFVLNNNSYFYKTIFALQVLFYVFAVIGGVYKNKNSLFDLPYMFCMMNTAAVVGLFRFVTGKQKVTWEKVG